MRRKRLRAKIRPKNQRRHPVRVRRRKPQANSPRRSSMGTQDDDKTTPFIRDDDSPASSRSGKPALDPYRTPGVPKQRAELGGMFGNFTAAKKRKMPGWAIPLLTTAAVFHVALFVVMWAKSIWEIE